MAAGDRIARTDQIIDTVFVPIGATFAIVRQKPTDLLPLAIGMVGREGVVGWPILLGCHHWQHDIVTLVAGEVVEIAAPDLVAACRADERLHGLILRFVHNFTLQLAQSVVANLGHSVERRVARWLLMIHDRVATDSLTLTHDQLASLLNVRRATVTDALHMLEGELLIRCTRGRVAVRDRAGLERAAAHSYGFCEADYRAAIGPFGKGSESV